MDNLEIGQWPLNVSRVSLVRFVLFLHMSISRGSYENVLFGERGRGERVVQNFFSTNAHPPLLHSRLRAEKKRKAGGGANNQRR